MANQRPTFEPPANLAVGFELQRTTSPFAKTIFKNTGKNILDFFFGSATFHKKGKVKIVAENNVGQTIINQMTAFWDANANGFLDIGETKYFEYQVVIIVSKDFSYLVEAYENTSPASDEVIFFLEDNQGDWLSGSYASIKVGTDFQQNLNKLDIISQIETSNNHFHRYLTDNLSYQLDFSHEQIAELIKTGTIERATGVLPAAIMGAIQNYFYYSGVGYGYIAQGLDWIVAEINKKFLFTEIDWDPDFEANAGKEVFIPYLFTPIAKTINWSFEEQDKNYEKIKNQLDKELNAYKSRFGASRSSLINPSTPNFAINYTFQTYLSGAFQMTQDILDWIYSQTSAIMDALKDYDAKLLNIANAYYCGLLNGLLGIITGIIDSISLPFKIMAASANLATNAQNIQQQILELFDEFIQQINLENLKTIIKECYTTIIEQCLALNFWAFTASISLEKVAYFFGNMIGFIVQLVVDELLTGGVKGIKDLLDKSGNLGKSLKDFILTKIQIITAQSKNIYEIILKLIRLILAELKNGPANFKKIIIELFETLRQTAQVAGTTLAAIKFNLQISTKEMNIFTEELGLNFVKVGGDGMDMVASLCKISD